MTRGRGERDPMCATCKEPGLLLWYAAGSLEADDRALVQQSIEACPTCRLEAADNQQLAQAIRLAAAPGAEREAAELVALAAGPREQIRAAGLSAADESLVDILRKVDSVDDADGHGWGARLRRGWVSLSEGSAWAWLRSPAVAYVLLAGLAYPAFVGLTSDAPGGPHVLEPPRSVDTGTRAGGEAEVSPGDDGGTVLTVFVPIDSSYRYRLEIRDANGRVRFADDDVSSFDGIGTMAIFVPPGFLHEGGYEVRVTELERTGAATEVQQFRFPFRLQ